MTRPDSHAVYNVFKRRQRPALRCAVRQDRPVPAFIQAETWEFGGTVSAALPPVGFQSEAAEQAMRLLGYYLFTSLVQGGATLLEAA